MRKVLCEELEACRVLDGPFGSTRSFGPYGHFLIDGPCAARLVIISAGGEESLARGWEHVSTSSRDDMRSA